MVIYFIESNIIAKKQLSGHPKSNGRSDNGVQGCALLIVVNSLYNTTRMSLIVMLCVLLQDGEQRLVHQYHFSGWPDHGVPDSATPLINFTHVVRRHRQSEDQHAPLIVHCRLELQRRPTRIDKI